MADEILMARREAPDAAGGKDEAAALTYSSDAGGTESVDAKRKRPKRRPRPELIKRRLHASDPEAGVPEDGAEGLDEAGDDLEEALVEEGETVDGEGESKAPVAEDAETEAVAVTAESAPGEDGDGKDPGSP